MILEEKNTLKHGHTQPFKEFFWTCRVGYTPQLMEGRAAWGTSGLGGLQARDSLTTTESGRCSQAEIPASIAHWAEPRLLDFEPAPPTLHTILYRFPSVYRSLSVHLIHVWSHLTSSTDTGASGYALKRNPWRLPAYEFSHMVSLRKGYVPCGWNRLQNIPRFPVFIAKCA